MSVGSETAQEGQHKPAQVSRFQIFTGFLLIGMFGFGGIAAAMHHVMVERRRWLTNAEYASILGLGQVLPGANLVNMATIVGDRFQGTIGALLALIGLTFMPIVILVALAEFYDHFANMPDVVAGTRAAAAGAVGMIFGTGWKLARTIVDSRWAFAFAVSSFVAIGILRLPLVGTLLVLATAAIAVGYWSSTRAK